MDRVTRRWVRSPDVCQVEDCDGVPHARGWCSAHYQRWRKQGSEHYERVPKYSALHLRLKTARGSASEHPCAMCEEPASQWSYNHTDPDEIFGQVRDGSRRTILVPYSLNLDYYDALCGVCHRRLDLATKRARLEAQAERARTFGGRGTITPN